jgi:hypothetical protein
VVEAEGAAPTRTSATRKVYAADGALVHSETWTTSYEGEKRVVRIGTKVEPKPKEKKPDPKAPVEEGTPPAETTTTPPTTPRP